MAELVTTFVVALVSAVIPLVNLEAYLVGVSVTLQVPALATALVAATGQMLGKIIFWVAGAGLLQLERFARHGTARGRWQQRIERILEWCRQHTWGPSLVTVASALSGLPPFAVWSVLAGTIRMRLWLFLALGLVGRFVRFYLVLLAPGLVPGVGNLHWDGF